jgi:eukaryotic-like serine/threonine-protein kinase
VALKRLDKELAQQAFYRDGFIAEAQITGQLEHPNIVPVHELAIDDRGIPYFTMKLVQGVSLARWLRDPARPLGSTDRIADSLEVFVKVCDAVAYAHHRGVIHRDLKPDNIIVAGFGQVYVMDWGLARLTRTRPASGDNAQMEAPGPVGTPAYMSPEQARGNPSEMDERSDVFGLGAILYEIVCGRTPFGPELDADRIIELSRSGQVIPLEQQSRGIGISKRLRNIVMKAVQPQPADRYQSVAELRHDVRTFLLGGLHLPRRAHAAGELIIREGEAGDAAYIIVSGQCRAFRQIGEQEETLETMGPGDVFGEMALLLDQPRAASVVAVEPATLLVLDRATLSEGLGVEGWTGALVRALAERFRDLERTVRSSGLRRG